VRQVKACRRVPGAGVCGTLWWGAMCLNGTCRYRHMVATGHVCGRVGGWGNHFAPFSSATRVACFMSFADCHAASLRSHPPAVIFAAHRGRRERGKCEYRRCAYAECGEPSTARIVFFFQTMRRELRRGTRVCRSKAHTRASAWQQVQCAARSRCYAQLWQRA